MIVRTDANAGRLRSAVNRMNSDSGVVTRMWGGWRTSCCRSQAGVSPVRTIERIGAIGTFLSAASCAISASGTSRLR